MLAAFTRTTYATPTVGRNHWRYAFAYRGPFDAQDAAPKTAHVVAETQHQAREFFRSRYPNADIVSITPEPQPWTPADSVTLD